mgnify:FL=1
MQARLLIIVLPWEADIVGDVDSVAVGVVVDCGFAEGVVVGLPDDYGVLVGQHLRGAEMVVDVVIDILVGAGEQACEITDGGHEDSFPMIWGQTRFLYDSSCNATRSRHQSIARGIGYLFSASSFFFFTFASNFS